MVRYEINHDGEIVEHDSALCNDLDSMLQRLFSQYSWNAKIINKQGSCRTIELNDANGHSKSISVYCGTIRNEARNAYEKKIQLGTSSDPRTKNKETTIIVGVYVFEANDGIDDAIFVGYPIVDSINYDTNPSIRGTFVNQLLLNAKNDGFVYDKEHNTVGFRAAFAYYYLENHYKLHYTSDKFPEVSYGDAELKSDTNVIDEGGNVDKKKIKFKTGLKSNFSRNRILFGAPGTGKSYSINKDRITLVGDSEESEEYYERVTFHPDYSYAHFVGTYKPVMVEENCNIQSSTGKKDISYEYVPGPFMRMYVKALKNSMTNDIRPFLLIIEEINRANVAAVFGDVFQLLDRSENGVSEYSIQASEDMKKYLAAELQVDPKEVSKLRIPDNMFIWATMNSADQGVFPMDTAFKRRWDFSYLGIDDSDRDIVGKFVTVGSKEQQRFEWNELRKAINEYLAEQKINEDKQLGPYFISRNIVVPSDGGTEIDSKQFCDVFKNKVIMYLFDDAAKQKRSSLFKGSAKGQTRFSKICEAFDEQGIGIFNETIQNAVKIEDLKINEHPVDDLVNDSHE